MLKALGWLIKLSLFSVAVLLAGDWVHWNGKTLSQHVRAQVSQARRTEAVSYVRDLTRKVTEDARVGSLKKEKQRERAHVSTHASARGLLQSEITDQTETQASAPEPARHPLLKSEVRTVARTEEQIPPSEREKLRALIHELNSSHD